MPKGFGVPTEKQLGYVLVVIPSANVYAAKFSLDGPGEQFVGITNMLDSAQVWKRPHQAEKSLSLYADLIIEQILEDGKAELQIRRLYQKSKKIMEGETVKKIIFDQEDLLENHLDE